MKRLMLLLCLLAVLSGCGQKVPVLGDGENLGMLAVPMDVYNNTGFPFTRYFVLSNSENPDFSVRLDPCVGRYFALSEPVPPGEYVFDTETTYLVPSSRFSSTTHKGSRRLNPPWKVQVEKETLLIAGQKYSVMFKKGENHMYWTNTDITHLDWNERKDYTEKLSQLENADKWRIVGQWEQY